MHKRLDFFSRELVYNVRLVNFRSFPSPQGYTAKLEPKSCLACYQLSVICLLFVMVNDLDPPPRAIRVVSSVCRTVLCVHVFILVLSFGQGSGYPGPATGHTSHLFTIPF